MSFVADSVHISTLWRVYVDGASRGNPGRGGAGIVVYRNDQLVKKYGYYLGIRTNNQAEYCAFLLALYHVKKLMNAGDFVEIISDSQLVIRQMQGVYKIRNDDLIAMARLARSMIGAMKCTFVHVLREDNELADEMANKGIDDNVHLPAEFLTLLREYHNTW